MDSTYNVNYKNDSIDIVLSGRLDTNNAPDLIEDLKSYIGRPVTDITFHADDLAYISSAGLRAIIFAKQRINPKSTVHLIGAQQTIVDVIKLSGFDTFLSLQDN